MSLVVAYPTVSGHPGSEQQSRIERINAIKSRWQADFREADIPFMELESRHAMLDGRAERKRILAGARFLLAVTGEVDQSSELHLRFDPHQASHVVAAAEARVRVVVPRAPYEAIGLTVMEDAIETAWSGPGCNFLEPGDQIDQLRALMSDIRGME